MTADLVRCTRCRRVSFAVTRAAALSHVVSFNAYYESLDDEGKACFGGPSSLADYSCLCGGTDFVPAVDGDVPDGVTVSGVIYEPNAEAAGQAARGDRFTSAEEGATT